MPMINGKRQRYSFERDNISLCYGKDILLYVIGQPHVGFKGEKRKTIILDFDTGI